MRSFTAGQIPSDAGRRLIEVMQGSCCGDEHWKFHAGVSYRNLLIYRPRDGRAPFRSDTYTTPPHDIPGQPIVGHLPLGSGACDLRELMDRSVRLFAEAEVNRERVAGGELPATQIWLWGQGKVPALVPFHDRFGVHGAVITAVDLLRGMGRLVGFDVVEVPGATGYTDTDYAAKGRYAIETLKETDFVVVHVEATDEASHEGDAHAKVQALERIDADIVGPVHEFLKSQGDYRLLICPDHPTFLRTKTHSHGWVPFAMCGAGIAHEGAAKYSEPAAQAAGNVIRAGHELMERFTRRTS
jgi:2,3-bisphosphoglycerate-independent phosphoglycerate mutase